MEVISNKDKLTYNFYSYNNISEEYDNLIGFINIQLCKNYNAELLKICFEKGIDIVKYWFKVRNDLYKKKYKFVYHLLKENMLSFDEKLDIYRKMGFITNFKKLPVSVYYKNDEVYRIIPMYIKQK